MKQTVHSIKILSKGKAGKITSTNKHQQRSHLAVR